MTHSGHLRLGLIGDNIRASRAPDLHRHCGLMHEVGLSYELFIPPTLGLGFDEVFAQCRDSGMRGLNITLPYKERAARRVRIADPMIERIGAVNTVLFGEDGPEGFNTDYTGFVAAIRAAGAAPPGVACVIGAGGVGRAVAFGLVDLGAAEIRIVDTDIARARALAEALHRAGAPVRIVATDDLRAALDGADAVLNCTPLGMVGYGGSPVPDGAFPHARWAFDAVYTPVETRFRQQALEAGAAFVSGFELFFWQGVHAFELFTGRPVEDTAALRRFLLAGGALPDSMSARGQSA